jgi:hypothetical protein
MSNQIFSKYFESFFYSGNDFENKSSATCRPSSTLRILGGKKAHHASQQGANRFEWAPDFAE